MTSQTGYAIMWTQQIREQKARLEYLCRARDAAIVGMHEEDGIPKSRVSDKLRAALALGTPLGDGYKNYDPLTEEQIEGLGVSEWSVRRVFDKAREEADNRTNVLAREERP